MHNFAQELRRLQYCDIHIANVCRQNKKNKFISLRKDNNAEV